MQFYVFRLHVQGVKRIWETTHPLGVHCPASVKYCSVQDAWGVTEVVANRPDTQRVSAKTRPDPEKGTLTARKGTCPSLWWCSLVICACLEFPNLELSSPMSQAFRHRSRAPHRLSTGEHGFARVGDSPGSIRQCCCRSASGDQGLRCPSLSSSWFLG